MWNDLNQFLDDLTILRIREMKNAMDAINHPPHYTQGTIETIDMIEEIVQPYPDAVIGGSIWQVVKYISRAPHKGHLVEDLKKARWYLDRAISHAEDEST